MAMFGFSESDFANNFTEVWEENAQTFDLFCKLQTQWRTGFNGPTGLDYTATWTLIDRYNAINPVETFDDIRAMELAALEQMASNRESEK